MELPNNEIRTYLAYTLPIDPVRIVTIPDMDLSFALGATLVNWSRDKQISQGLSKKWEYPDPRRVRFTLQDNLKWSDGSRVKVPR